MPADDMKIVHAEVQLPCNDLAPTLDFFVVRLGFRVETIFPAEDPDVASLSGFGLRLRLAPGSGDPGLIRLVCDDAGPVGERLLVAPNGTRIELVAAEPAIEVPPLAPEFILTRAADGPPPGAGRAGMIYRDLIPGRLGGRFIASHIAIPQGGPVADWVHYHLIRFQMIFCRRGWARLVYEDQGEPFVMAAGDCVLQPPAIRHRVLESSPGFEVIEIGCPALHQTQADYNMDLPTPRVLPDRDFGGQRFLHSVAAATPWVADGGFERRGTGMRAATGGLADAFVLRPGGERRFAAPAHTGELLFGFLLEGSCVLERGEDWTLASGDAFVIPAGEAWGVRKASADLQLLQVEAGVAAEHLPLQEKV